MESKKETRPVTHRVTVEVPVEELRAQADRMEQSPYDFDYTVSEGETREKCMTSTTDSFSYKTVTHFCEGKATHFYVTAAGAGGYCSECARKIGQKNAQAFRRRHQL